MSGTHPSAGPLEVGRFTFTAAEITRFAALYDPQPAHLDAAAEGGPVASGWHVVSAWMGACVRALEAASPSTEDLPPDDPRVVSPIGVGFGCEDLSWPSPVRAGDRIVFFTEVLEARESASRPGWVIVRRRNTARREDGTLVMDFHLTHLAPVAPPPASPEA